MGRVVSILAVVLGCGCLAAPAQADFGFSEFDVAFEDASGLPETQAGSHPFAFTTAFTVNDDGEDTEGHLKELLLDLPMGLVFDPGAAPRCAADGFAAGNCPLSTVVGIATVEAGEPGQLEDTRIYSLVTGEGPLRLGFVIDGAHSVVIDVLPDSEFPHNPIAIATGWPGTLDVFSVELELWGVPAAAAHEAARGDSVEVQERPLLTLPTNCSWLVNASYEADSWEGGYDEGGTDGFLTMTGCERLSFSPTIHAQPTTNAAGTATGLDLSLEFSDPGLLNPDGLAESQVKTIVLDLPGMHIDPGAAAGIGLCSPGQLAEEGPVATEDEGCPDASLVGAFEVESPLIQGGTLDGELFLADIWTWSGEALANVYAVARSADLGIVLKQKLEFEPDFLGDDLSLYAEFLPQLPLQRLDLTLFDDESSLLISPPHCGAYEIVASIHPWSSEDWLESPSGFAIETGPGGGPCPVVESSDTSSDRDSSPVATPPVIALSPALRRPVRRCPKSKRAVRRKGKRVCIRRCRKGKRVVRRKGKLRCVKVKKRTHRKHHRRGR